MTALSLASAAHASYRSELCDIGIEGPPSTWESVNTLVAYFSPCVTRYRLRLIAVKP
jgi:hypothetical protein